MTDGTGTASPAGSAYSLVAIPGDGVGPEVVGHARTVLDAAAAAFGFEVAWDEVLAGGAAIDTHGTSIRPEDVERCATADAVLLGAVGGPRWDDPNAKVRPEQALFALRGGLGLFANLRPVSVHPALVPSSPLRPELLEGVDLLIVRELTGGIYFGRPSEERETADGRIAVDTLWYAESEIRRIARLAFELARTRRSKVTQVDKANVLASSRLWRKVTEEVHADFPDVELENRLVDSTAMLLVTRPSMFDVVVTENLFGDILSDEAAVLAGSLGMLPSASLGERRTGHGTFGMYEPIHGSAPDLAGTDRANPIGTILSAAMLCRWSLGRADAAGAIEAAVGSALEDGFRTADLVSSGPATGAGQPSIVGGSEMAAVIARHVATHAGATTSPDALAPSAADRQAVGA